MPRARGAGRGPGRRPARRRVRRRPGRRAGADPADRAAPRPRRGSTWPTSCGSGTSRSGAAAPERAGAAARPHRVGAVAVRRFPARDHVDARHLQVVRELELASIISVPFLAEGRPLGVLTLAADAQRGRFTAADVEVAEQLALQVALVVAKAQRYELDTRRPTPCRPTCCPPAPPEVAGLRTAVRYLAATHGVEVGGDFYDVVRAARRAGRAGGRRRRRPRHHRGGDDGPAHLRVPGAAGGPARAERDDRPAAGVLVAAGPAAHGDGAVRDARPRRPASSRIASAGHLPPLLFTGGRAEFLPVRPSRMLGAPPAPAPALEWAGVLPAGATLVLFTDGLVESRTADIDEGLAHLLRPRCRRPGRRTPTSSATGCSPS